MIRRLTRIVALALVVVIATKVGWDSALWDARLQALVHLAAALAIGVVAWMALRGEPMPRTPIDLPLVALLVVEGVATISSWNIGLSAPAFAGIVATALMLPVALLALRHRPDLTALVAVVPVIGLAAISLWTLAWRRVDWVLAGGPGLPPVRLPNEVTQFGLVTVPPFVLLATLPLALVVTRPGLRRWLVWMLLALCLPLTLVSGSRSAWIAFGVAGAAMAASSLGELRVLLRLSPRRIAAAAALLVVGAVGIAYVAPRLTQTSSLVYRGRLWDATLHVWSADPLLGIGPGGMGYARQAIAPLVQPHSHDVPLGILGDAGLLGLALAVVLFIRFAWVVRPRQGHSLGGRAAFAVLVGISVGFLTDDLTFLPNMNLLLVLLVALALRDAGAVTWRPLRLRRRGWWFAGMAAAAAGLLGVALLADASAIWYRAGTDAASAGRWADAEGAFAAAVQLNPMHPAGPKALALAADHVGDAALARDSAARAVALNPGDWASWTNLSLLCLQDGDRSCAGVAAGRAVNASGRSVATLVNAALVEEALGRPAAADDLYREALLADWEVGVVVPWPRPLTVDEVHGTVIGSFDQQLARLVVRRNADQDLEPESYALASIRALAFAIEGNREAAGSALEAAEVEEPADPITWDVATLLLAHWGEDNAAATRMGDIARGWALATAHARDPAALLRHRFAARRSRRRHDRGCPTAASEPAVALEPGAAAGPLALERKPQDERERGAGTWLGRRDRRPQPGCAGGTGSVASAELARRQPVDSECRERFGHQRPVAPVATSDGDAIAGGEDRLQPSAAHGERAGHDRLPATPEQVAGNVGGAAGPPDRGEADAQQVGIRATRLVEHEQRAVQDHAILGELRWHLSQLREGSQRVGEAGHLEAELTSLAEGDGAGPRPPRLEEIGGVVEGRRHLGRLHCPDARRKPTPGRLAAGRDREPELVCRHAAG